MPSGHGGGAGGSVVGFFRYQARPRSTQTLRAMNTRAIPTHGCWAFAEFTDVYEMQEDFADKVGAAFEEMLATVCIPERPFPYMSRQHA